MNECEEYGHNVKNGQCVQCGGIKTVPHKMTNLLKEKIQYEYELELTQAFWRNQDHKHKWEQDGEYRMCLLCGREELI